MTDTTAPTGAIEAKTDREPQCVPVSAEEAAQIDVALGLKTLPPIRVDEELYAAIEAAAKADGLIVQAWVRRTLEEATEDLSFRAKWKAAMAAIGRSL